MTNLQDGLKKLAEDLNKVSPPRYCAEHKPCDAKEHAEGYKMARRIGKYVFGVLAWGCVLMIAANTILSDWLSAADTLSYGQAILGTAGLYALAEIRKGLG